MHLISRQSFRILVIKLFALMSLACTQELAGSRVQQANTHQLLEQYLRKPFIHTAATDSKIHASEAFTTFIPFHKFPDWDASGGTWHDNWRMQARNQPHESMVAIALAQVGRCGEAEGILRSLFFRTANSGAIEYHAMRERNRFADNPRQIGAPLLAWITLQVTQSCRHSSSIIPEALASLRRNWDWWRGGAGGRKFHEGTCKGLWHWNNQYEAIRDSNRQAGHPNLPSWYDAQGQLFITEVCPVDLNALLVTNLRALAQLTGQAGNTPEAAGYTQEADQLAATIRAKLWSKDDKFFLNLRNNGNFVPHKDIGGWFALLGDIADSAQANAMVQSHLKCGHAGQDSFCTAVGMPAMARDVPGYGSNEHWLGGTWPTYTLLAVEGLHRYGFKNEASRISRSLVQTITQALAAGRPLPEWYDSERGVVGGLLCPEQADTKEKQRAVNCNYITSSMALPLAKYAGLGTGIITTPVAPVSLVGSSCRSAGFTTCKRKTEDGKFLVCTRQQVFALCESCIDGKVANPQVEMNPQGYYHDVAKGCDLEL